MVVVEYMLLFPQLKLKDDVILIKFIVFKIGNIKDSALGDIFHRYFQNLFVSTKYNIHILADLHFAHLSQDDHNLLAVNLANGKPQGQMASYWLLFR